MVTLTAEDVGVINRLVNDVERLNLEHYGSITQPSNAKGLRSLRDDVADGRTLLDKLTIDVAVVA